jgi:hypothetical protein
MPAVRRSRKSDDDKHVFLVNAMNGVECAEGA